MPSQRYHLAQGNVALMLAPLYWPTMAGACRAATEMLSDGRIRLLEEWQWTNGDLSVGKSVVEELRT